MRWNEEAKGEVALDDVIKHFPAIVGKIGITVKWTVSYGWIPECRESDLHVYYDLIHWE